MRRPLSSLRSWYIAHVAAPLEKMYDRLDENAPHSGSGGTDAGSAPDDDSASNDAASMQAELRTALVEDRFRTAA